MIDTFASSVAIRLKQGTDRESVFRKMTGLLNLAELYGTELGLQLTSLQFVAKNYGLFANTEVSKYLSRWKKPDGRGGTIFYLFFCLPLDIRSHCASLHERAFGVRLLTFPYVFLRHSRGHLRQDNSHGNDRLNACAPLRRWVGKQENT